MTVAPTSARSWHLVPGRAVSDSRGVGLPEFRVLLRRQPGRVGSNMDRTGYYCFVHAADSLLGGQTTDKCFGAMLQ